MPIALGDNGAAGTGISQETHFFFKRLVKAQNWSGTGDLQTCQGHAADVAPDASFTVRLCPELCLRGCKEMAMWDLRASCCADLDKNHPGQSHIPFSNSLSLNSELGRSRTEDHLGMGKNFLVSFVMGSIKFFCVLRYDVALSNYLNIIAALSFITLLALLWASLLFFSFLPSLQSIWLNLSFIISWSLISLNLNANTNKSIIYIHKLRVKNKHTVYFEFEQNCFSAIDCLNVASKIQFPYRKQHLPHH